ncbi:MAG: outer-membrane lipoprotein carrier protein LolA [Bacteroidaceae bacterium]|nr:outer-membrane lipoprotein carrier protein LolA [Bacteroidaceae bacterium]
MLSNFFKKAFAFCVFSVCLIVVVWAGQSNKVNEAKKVLNRVATTFRSAGGVNAKFTIKIEGKDRRIVHSNGSIQLKGKRFVLNSNGMITWYNGKTQWTYSKENDEVNVSIPTKEELQSINPYALLYAYQKDYVCRFGNIKSFAGKAVTEILLTAIKPDQNYQKVVLYVMNKTYQPLFIKLQSVDGSQTEISIVSYKTNLKYADDIFIFYSSKYPNAEIIDLR